MSFRFRALISAACSAIFLQAAPAHAQEQRNLILFVPDGLRALSVTPEATPAMAAVRDKGVNFANPHSLFPTFTMANASGLSTGHFLGDTGVFSNTIYVGFPTAHAANSVTPFIENDPVLGDIDAHFSGNFVDEDAILFAARHQGFSTAAIGKVGPIMMFDHTDRKGETTIIVDDATGSAQGIPLSQAMQDALKAAGLPLAAPSRGPPRRQPATRETAGHARCQCRATEIFRRRRRQGRAANVQGAQQTVRAGFLVARSRRHTTQSGRQPPESRTPGINGPTSLAAIKNADDNLAQLRQALDELGPAGNHRHHRCRRPRLLDHFQGKQDQSAGAGELCRRAGRSAAARFCGDRPRQGARAAAERPRRQERRRRCRQVSQARQRADRQRCRTNPEVVVAANGGSDLVYVPGKDAALTAKVDRSALLAQDYVSGLVRRRRYSASFPGTLPLSAINLKGSLVTPRPSIVINFRSYSQPAVSNR